MNEEELEALRYILNYIEDWNKGDKDKSLAEAQHMLEGYNSRLEAKAELAWEAQRKGE